MTTNGNWGKVYINGYDLTQDGMQFGYNHAFQDQKVLPFNVGFEQHAPGIFTPSANFGGYKQVGQGAITAHNLLSPYGPGCANDVEFIISAMLGNCAAPAQGDIVAMMSGTLMDFKGDRQVSAIQTFSSAFRGRGKRAPLGIMLVNSLAKGTVTSAEYDDGAASVDTTKGGVAALQITTPTGVQAGGTISLSGNPSDTDNFVITVNGTAYTFTFKTSPSAAGHVLIGATAAASIGNLFAALTGGLIVSGNYYTGTTPLPSSLVIVSKPSASNVITLTAVATGTAANAWALAKTGTNLAVSGATFSGGVAGETASIVLATAPTQGGSYTTLVTFAANGTSRLGEWVEVAVGTNIGRWLKVTATLSGSTQNFGFNVCFGRFFQS